jgi:DNA-binding NarL/FixJ family response regulator
MKVLVADDSELYRQQLISDLSDIPGIEVIGQAGNGKEAVNLIRSIEPDVVILDIRMPGGNGIDVLRNIKKHRGLPVVIMLTNYPYPQYRKKSIEAGADFFFDKSGEFEKVFETLQHLIHSS